MDAESVKKAHKVIRKISIENLEKIYALLNASLKPEDCDPESLYGGTEHPVTGLTLDEQYQIEEMMDDLFSGIKNKKPVAWEKSQKTIVVWPEGTGKPVYQYPGDCGYFQNVPIYKGKRGKFIGHENFGLGVPIHIAMAIWGFDVLKGLPEAKDYIESKDQIALNVL